MVSVRARSRLASNLHVGPGQNLDHAGLSYIGLWDDLSLFNRALTADQVRSLTTLRVAELIK